ncbi:extracellular solute-binding protein [Kribbella sp. NPDC003505]|uniref:ABC transporter substrate-binding protein n=1 Tax=Kribbella sp. NPDC003505 TaxID=3154448 RepID=UPI0033B5273A
MKRRKAALLATVTSATLLLGACGGNGDSKQDAANAANWRNDISAGQIEAGVLPAKGTPGLTYLEGLAKKIETEVPGSTVKLTFANTEARPGLEQRWRGGNGPDVDYGMFDGTNPAQLVWADDGALLNLRPYLEQKDPATGKTWLDAFSPAALDFMTNPKDKGIYGVPTELSTQVLFYNKGMFDKLGITPPTTWAQFEAAADKLLASKVAPVAVTGLFHPYMGMWSDNLWLRTVGWKKANAVLARSEGSLSDDPGFLKGLEMLQAMRDKKYFAPGFEGTDFTPAQAQFFQGKTGIILMGSWLVGEMKDVIPADFEIGVLPFPSVEGASGDQKALMSAAQLISVNAKGKNIPLTLNWVSKITSATVQTERAEKFGELSAVVGVPSPKGVTGIDQVVAGADPLVPREFATAGTKAHDLIYSEIARLMFGQQDAKETLKRLDEGLARLKK